MKPALGLVRVCSYALLIIFLTHGTAFSVTTETLSLKRAVELALAHSPAAGEAIRRIRRKDIRGRGAGRRVRRKRLRTMRTTRLQMGLR